MSDIIVSFKLILLLILSLQRNAIPEKKQKKSLQPFKITVFSLYFDP